MKTYLFLFSMSTFLLCGPLTHVDLSTTQGYINVSCQKGYALMGLIKDRTNHNLHCEKTDKTLNICMDAQNGYQTDGSFVCVERK